MRLLKKSKKISKQTGNIEKLNIGCGNDVLEDYLNLDIASLSGVDVIHDLNKFPWPFEDNKFEEIRMINVLEHLPDTIKTMEEVWRISCSGAKITIRVPYWNCYQSVGDPTHLKQFHQRSFDFFDPEKMECRNKPYYTMARFKISKVSYWIPMVPVGGGRGWIRFKNSIVKGLLSFLATYLNNIIWGIEFKLIALKDQR